MDRLDNVFQLKTCRQQETGLFRCAVNTHAVRVLSLLTSPVQHSALKWSNSIVVLATLALAGPQSAVALGPSMPRSQKQSRPPNKRGFQLSLPQLLSSLTHSLCVRLCPLPVSGLDEVLVGSGASVNLHYYEFIHAHMSPPSFFSFPNPPHPFSSFPFPSLFCFFFPIMVFSLVVFGLLASKLHSSSVFHSNLL